MSALERVTIVGLGLIGGSLGLSLRERQPGVHVTAVDRPDVIALAAARQAAHSLVPSDDTPAVDAALDAELVVLAVPVSVIQRELPRALDRAQVVIDCGSTKRAICDVVASHPRRARFVPGHPMAGAPEGGIERARADLFQGRRWLICPEDSAADARAVAEGLIELVGSELVALTADEHDRAVALTSHVPQILASALLAAASSAGAAAAAGPAFADATRVAGGPEAVWRDIFATNADQIGGALAELLASLDLVRRELDRTPPELDAVRQLLERARQLRNR